MRRPLEICFFVALALLLHLAFFLRVPERGAQAGGAGGEAMVTILAASEQVETMVADWKRPPETVVSRTAFAPPEPPAPDVPTPRDLPAPAVERLPDLTLPVPAQPPDAPVALPEPPPEREPVSKTDPETGQLVTSLRPTERATPPAHMLKPPPPPQPEPPSRTAKPGERAQKASQGSTGQRAAGSGGGAVAGAGRAEVTTGASAAQTASLRKTWGAKIRNRIERAKRYPAGRRQAARATVALEVTRDGRLAGASLARSSGIAAFDQAALQAVRRAGRFPAAPNGLTAASYSFTVTISFK
ncbi:MAG: energy transducer TonB [Tropicimonas sp.]|uniref:energy transducer TonB n=1 Tax=Tropicimonas sp. TaxID=2067044 RepID=UPI003A8C0A4E